MNASRSKGGMVGLVMWLVIGASFGLSAQTWIEIARMTGFDQSTSIARVDVTLRLAWLMPMVVDGYVVVALLLWMSDVNERLAAFARKNTYAAAGFGVVAQSAFHAATIASTSGHQRWAVPLSAVVGAIPPGFAALAVHMRVLVARHAGLAVHPETEPVVVSGLTPSADPGQPARFTSTEVVATELASSLVTPDSDPGSRASGNAEIVRRIHESHPEASRAELARLTGLSPSTVKRYRPADPGQPVTVTRVNGRVPAMVGPEVAS